MGRRRKRPAPKAEWLSHPTIPRDFVLDRIRGPAIYSLSSCARRWGGCGVPFECVSALPSSTPWRSTPAGRAADLYEQPPEVCHAMRPGGRPMVSPLLAVASPALGPDRRRRRQLAALCPLPSAVRRGTGIKVSICMCPLRVGHLLCARPLEPRHLHTRPASRCPTLPRPCHERRAALASVAFERPLGAQQDRPRSQGDAGSERTVAQYGNLWRSSVVGWPCGRRRPGVAAGMKRWRYATTRWRRNCLSRGCGQSIRFAHVCGAPALGLLREIHLPRCRLPVWLAVFTVSLSNGDVVGW